MRLTALLTAITLATLLSGGVCAAGWTLEKSFEGFILPPIEITSDGPRVGPISRTVYVPVLAENALLGDDDSTVHTVFRAQSDGFDDWTRPEPPKGILVDPRRIPKEFINENTFTPPSQEIITQPQANNPSGQGTNSTTSGGETSSGDPAADKIAQLTVLVEQLVSDKVKESTGLGVTGTDFPGREEERKRDYPAGTTETFIVLFVMAGGAFIFALLTAMEFRRRWILSISAQNGRISGTGFEWNDDDFSSGPYLPDPRMPLDYRY